MRVLLTAAPDVGHIAPLLGVGQALKRAGHEVRLATHVSRHDMVVAAGLDVVSAGMSSAERSAERLRRWPESDGQPVNEWAVRMFTEIQAPSTLADIRAVAEAWRPHLLIHEEGEYAGPVAAAAAGIPWVTHGWGSPLRSDDDLRRLEADAAGLWALASIEMPARAGLYEHGLINPCPSFLDPHLPGVDTCWPVRPSTLGEKSGDPSATLTKAKGGQRPLCYVGFGTVPQFANAIPEITAAVDGAQAGGLDVVVTTSDPSLADAVRARAVSPSSVEVREFVSLSDLLPRCRLVVGHGGAGTTLAALAHGVPLVIVPRGTPSQQRMATAVTTAGVGLVAEATSIAEVVRAAAVDDALFHRAQAAKREIAAMPSPESVVLHLEALGR